MIATATEHPHPKCKIQVSSLNMKNMCKNIFKIKELVRSNLESPDTLLFLNFLHRPGRWQEDAKKLETGVHQVMWEADGGAANCPLPPTSPSTSLVPSDALVIFSSLKCS